MKNCLYCFGLGYVSNYIISKLDDYEIIATKQNYESNENNIKIIKFDNLDSIQKNTTHIIVSIPPVDNIDLVFDRFYKQIIELKNLKWLGYLSATSVYGNHHGNIVDENSGLKPTNQRSINRKTAEDNWLYLYKKYNIPVNIFRISGIYGPNRNILERILNNENPEIIIAPNKFFSRIHITDLANIILKSMSTNTSGEIFNISDNLSCENSLVTEYAYNLLGIEPINYVSINEANLSKMMIEFYNDNKKICNQKIKKILGYQLLYPTYIEGLNSIKSDLNK